MKKNISVSKPRVFGVGILISAVISIIFLFLFAFILTIGNFSEDMALPLSSVSLGIGSFIGARYAAKKINEKGYLCGLIIGFSVFIINLIISLIFNSDNITLFSFIRLVIILLMAMLGGILGINSKDNRSLIK